MKTRWSLLVLATVAACSSSSGAGPDGSTTPVGTTGTPDGGAPGDDGGADASSTIEPSGTVGINLPKSTLIVRQGRSVTFDVAITRPTGVDGPVDVDINGLPPGANANTVHVAAGTTTATLQIDAASTTPQGTTNAAVVATSGARSDGAAALSLTVIGLPGTLDTSYGIGGRTVASAPFAQPICGGVAIQQSGASLLSYTSNVYRMRTDGVLDPTFGTNGMAPMPGDWPSFIGVDGSDRIVVAYRNTSGGGGSTAGVIRLTTNGARDATFGTNGVVPIDWASPISAFDDNVASLGIEPDGRLVVAGDRATSQAGAFVYSRVSIIRLNADGTPDATWTRYDAPYNSYGPKVARTADGSWMVATASGQIYRLTSTGALDSTFHGGTPVSGSGHVLVLADGSILYGGGGALGKLLANGDPDTTFGVNGVFTVPAGGPSIASFTLQSDGAILAAGGANSDFSTIRVLANGTVDTSFGTNGVAQTDIAAVSDAACGAVVQADAKIVVGGTSGGKVALVRYWP